MTSLDCCVKPTNATQIGTNYFSAKKRFDSNLEWSNEWCTSKWHGREWWYNKWAIDEWHGTAFNQWSHWCDEWYINEWRFLDWQMIADDTESIFVSNVFGGVDDTVRSDECIFSLLGQEIATTIWIWFECALWSGNVAIASRIAQRILIPVIADLRTSQYWN